jgi:integral membrane protein
MQSTRTFSWFRKTAFAEGVSFLVLLFIAMPLKYFAGMPLMVTIVGYLHGFLFVTLGVLTLLVKEKHAKKWSWAWKVFFASILPFGTFVMDKEWKKEEAAIARNPLL